MNSAQKQYANEMKKKFGYYATWNPGVHLKLGDIGTFKGNIFTKISDLESLGITFEVSTDITKATLEHSSKGSVSVTTKLAGTLAPQGSVLTSADAGIIVEFEKQKSCLFKANDTTSPSIKDTISLGIKILELYHQGKWNQDWEVITELVEAESATIIISNNANSKIELKANANINAPTFDIADGKFDFSTLVSKGLETKIIATEKLTPLFKIMGIKKKTFSPPVFKVKGAKPLDLPSSEIATEASTEEFSFGYLSSKEREAMSLG